MHLQKKFSCLCLLANGALVSGKSPSFTSRSDAEAWAKQHLGNNNMTGTVHVMSSEAIVRRQVSPVQVIEINADFIGKPGERLEGSIAGTEAELVEAA